MTVRRRKRVIDKTLGFHWYMQYGGTAFDAQKWYCEKFDVRVPGSVAGEDYHHGLFVSVKAVPYSGLIWIKDTVGAIVMAHEIAHAVVHVCRVLELDPREADEFQACYTGYLMGELNRLVQPG